MSLVRHSRRLRKVYFWEMLDRESRQELIDYKQGKLDNINIDDLPPQSDNLQSLTNYPQPLKTKFRTIFHCFLKKLKRIIN